MKEKESALFSRYIIDGIQHDATPYELLSECMNLSTEGDETAEFDDILDESTDHPLTSFTYNQKENETYISELPDTTEDRAFRMLYPETFTRHRIATALLDRIWNKGHFRLGDLSLWAEWTWNSKPLGNMAAFYSSVKAASEYIYDIGCHLEDFSYDGCDDESSFRVGAWLSGVQNIESDDSEIHETSLFKASPYESRHPWIEDERQCPEHTVKDPDSEIIYIPFDTSSFKLGGSLLAEIKGHNGGPSPKIQDPDYFIDCYEVVRELIEDGIVMAGETVGDGGLAKAVSRLCHDCGIELNLNGIISSYIEEDTTKILFSEIPGVVIQISSNNMDYLDSQLLLQDVAYYPLGSPTYSEKGVRLGKSSKAAVAGILALLMNQASEGED